MDRQKIFHELLKRDFFPLLRAEGFKGSGTTFRRTAGDRVDVLNIQAWRSGGKCCVNVAVHFLFLPAADGAGAADAKKIMECDCAFRSRLHEMGEPDHWWAYGLSDREAGASVASLIDTYRRRGGLFFAKFEPFPQVFEQITPGEIGAGDVSNMPGRFTAVLAALTMARIMHHLGNRDKCREFAEAGLRQLGRAAGLKEELERLRDT